MIFLKDGRYFDKVIEVLKESVFQMILFLQLDKIWVQKMKLLEQ